MQYLKIKLPYRRLRHTLAAPFIISVMIPMMIMDLWVEIYHRIAFPLYGIPCVERKKYVKVVDRGRLKYLRGFQKFNCMYCGYANGIIGYWVEIAGRTEKYFCGIQHEKDPNFIPPAHHKNFARYDDKKDFEEKYLD